MLVTVDWVLVTVDWVLVTVDWVLVTVAIHVACCYVRYMRHPCLSVLFLQEWDIDALEESTRYDGFSAKQPVIV